MVPELSSLDAILAVWRSLISTREDH